MKTVLHMSMSMLLTVLLAACATRHHGQSAPPPGRSQVQSEADAIAIVLAEIKRRGGDPRMEECSARPSAEGWLVTARHIWYPNNKGASRFVPGGFTDYIVSRDGKIVGALPGL